MASCRRAGTEENGRLRPQGGQGQCRARTRRLGVTLAAAVAVSPLAFVATARSEAGRATTNLVADGDFNTPIAATGQPGAAQGQGYFTDFCTKDGENADCPDASTQVGAWTVTSGSIDLLVPAYVNAPPSGPAGTQPVDLDGFHPGAISQTLPTRKGRTYTGSFMLAGNPDGTANAQSANPIKYMAVTVNGQTIARFSFNTAGRTPTDMGYRIEHFSFKARGRRTNLGFASKDASASANGAVITEVKVS